MQFIAQFKSSTCGTSNNVVTDVFLHDKKLISFNRAENGNFELKIIENNSYYELTKEFEDFIQSKELKSNDCNLFHLWRANKVCSPDLMPFRYYQDILNVYQWQQNIARNNRKEIQELINKLNQELCEHLSVQKK